MQNSDIFKAYDTGKRTFYDKGSRLHPRPTNAVNPSWASCGRCHMCRSGEENFCLYQKAIRAPGVGYDGGHAPYVLIPEARFLVPIGDLDPIEAAPLTDAGITT